MTQEFPTVTHVIFDMDGLLLDTEPRYFIALDTLCQRYGSAYTQEARRLTMGCTVRGCAEIVTSLLNLPISVDQFVEEIEELYRKAFEERVELLPGAEKLVRHLKENNIPICIATSSKEFSFKLKSKHHPEFFKMFHHIVTGSDDPEVKNGKPEPDIFLVAASRFDSPPAEMKNALVFEDAVNGVKAANAAGMQCVWVPAEWTDKTAEKATLTLSSLEEFNPAMFGLPPYKA